MKKSYPVWFVCGGWITGRNGKAKRKPPIALGVSTKRPPGRDWESDSFIDVVCPDTDARLRAGEVLQPEDIIKANWKIRFDEGTVQAWCKTDKNGNLPSLGNW